MDDETGWNRCSRLWALIEWALIGGAVIFTLIWATMNGFLSYISSPSAATIDRKSIKDKRVLIIDGQSESRLSKALANVLSSCYNCRVIVLGKEKVDVKKEEEPGSPNANIICDLSNSEELRLLLKRLWDEANGIDLVINCQIEVNNCMEIGQKVERIGSSIQLMINLLINLVPKMMDKGNGKFAIIKNCRPPTHDAAAAGATASEYDQLLDQLLSSTGTIPRNVTPHIGLVQLYCHGLMRQGESVKEAEIANRICQAIESGQPIVDVSKNDCLANFIRKFSNVRRQ